MNINSRDKKGTEGKENDGLLEKIANKIDPAGTGVTDDEIMDPGANIRDFPPDQKRENRNPPNQK